MRKNNVREELAKNLAGYVLNSNKVIGILFNTLRIPGHIQGVNYVEYIQTKQKLTELLKEE